MPGVPELLAALVRATGGEPREGQRRMADAVAAALATGEHLLVQAGTGTGKSFAYLVPALAADERVVVATATLALQAQLVERDVPRAVDALAPLLGRTPSFAVLKGRRNYACLLRVRDRVGEEQGAGEGAQPALLEVPTSRLGREVTRLRAWAEETTTGDRDEVSPAPPDDAWRAVSVSARECLGAGRCPYGEECFAERARATALEADVVVTNHALLAIDALEGVPVLPEGAAVVVDEAHELVDRATGAATDELTVAAVEWAARRCRGVIAGEVADGLADAASGLSGALRGAAPGRVVAWSPVLGAALREVRDAAHAVVSAFGGERERGDASREADRRATRGAVEAVFEVAERLLALSEHDVAWVETEQRRPTARADVLRVAPLAVGNVLREALFARRTVVLTSATLMLGGSFDSVAGSLGLPVPAPVEGDSVDAASVDASEGPRWRGLDVGSPFDHPRQGILYVAAHLPRPSRSGLSPALLDELTGLIRAAGGRTLGLFSSRRAAEEAAAALRSRVALPVLCQGDDALGALVRRFAAEPRSCLLGTLSLWQGVDVPGASCQLVVIDRIPFPRPDDPLASARSAAVDAAGGNGFLAVSVARAALLLAQGAGRLLRSASDRGVVAVLDPRMAPGRTSYSAFLVRSLPAFWFTTDPAQVRRSLAAIDAAAG
ncbi:MAG: ATP-dependent DNA helicase [Mycobacterium leprae]